MSVQPIEPQTRDKLGRNAFFLPDFQFRFNLTLLQPNTPLNELYTSCGLMTPIAINIYGTAPTPKQNIQVSYLLFCLFPALLPRALPGPFSKPHMYSLARFSIAKIHRHRGTKLYI